MIFEGLPSNARSTAHGARSAAATELRLSRCCDGELRRPAPLRSFCASRLDATRRIRRAFIFPRVDLNFNGRGPQS